jgi:hypothetical protein
LDDIGVKGMRRRRRACRKRNWFYRALLALCLSFPPSFLFLLRKKSKEEDSSVEEKKSLVSSTFLSLSLSENKKMVECRRNLKNDDSNSVTHRGKEKKTKQKRRKNKKGVFIRRHSTAVITQTDKKAKLLMPEGPKKGTKRTQKNIKQILSTEISQNE